MRVELHNDSDDVFIKRRIGDKIYYYTVHIDFEGKLVIEDMKLIHKKA